MAPISRTSPNARLVEKSIIDYASNALQDLPTRAKEQLSLREAVEILHEPIIEALNKGYSYEDIAATLAAQGIAIAPSSLKHYLSRSNRQRKAKSSDTPTRRRRTATQKIEDEDEDEVEEIQAPARAANNKVTAISRRRGAEAIESEPEAEPEQPARRGRQRSTTTQTRSGRKAT